MSDNEMTITIRRDEYRRLVSISHAAVYSIGYLDGAFSADRTARELRGSIKTVLDRLEAEFQS